MTSLRMKAILVLCAAAWMFLLPGGARSLESSDAPSALQPWASWVLEGHETEFCPSPFDNPDLHHCRWPSRLTLELDDAGGRFFQEWSLFDDLWVPLPGGPGQWPQDVRVNGEAVEVVSRGGIPHVRLLKGDHRLVGAFSWSALPETIRIPAATGLVELRIGGQRPAFPRRDADGRLWLKKRVRRENREDRLEVRVSRLLKDEIPMEVITRLDLRVSGRSREVTLDRVLPERSVPMSIDSGIPVRMDGRNRLLLQVRAGRWEIRIASRMEGPVHEIGPASGAMGREIWSFASRNHLRMVKVEGVSAIDPTQADVPSSWRSFPAYVVQPGDTVRFKEIRRGDPDPAPDRLQLRRTWWLDFDGSGYTVQDRISGTMNRNWSLAMGPPLKLGRVQVDGKDQLITEQGRGKEAGAGVELRKGSLHLTADSRFETSVTRIPAVGWDHDFQAVSAQLHLPPGWRLLTARGVDVLPGTWFERWTLLDLFLVLIIAMAVWRLRGWPWGVLALVCVGLVYHEPGAPRTVWLHLVASMALLRLLSKGWFRRVLQAWFLGAAVTLIVLSLPFMVQQARVGLYPQLESPVSWGGVGGGLGSRQMSPEAARAPLGKVADAVREREMGASRTKGLMQYAAKSAPPSPAPQQAALVQDPDALIQTGPGLPSWSWRTVNMGWNGPVDRTQQVRLWFIPPGVNTLLCFLRVGLLAALIAGLLGRKPWTSLGTGAAVAAVLLASIAFPQPSLATDSAEGGFPPKWMLEELERRLLEPDDCHPHCAELSKMRLETREGRLTLLLEVHAATRTAVPLPGALNAWSPNRVLVDGDPARGLFRDASGVLWCLLPRGIHLVTLHGDLAAARAVPLSLPLRPQRTVVAAEGWKVQGVRPDGTVEGTLQLIPERESADADPDRSETTLPPLLRVTRTLRLGLTWQVDTEVRRLTPLGAPVITSVPLIQGESVHTEGVRVEQGEARVHMGANEAVVRWVSSLEPGDRIRLQASGNVPWTEVWILDASPIWHCDARGIPVIHHQDKEGFWKPEWRPWPGEEVTLDITRPKAVPGRFTTMDEASLSWTPGKRFDKGALTVGVRTSRGGRQRIVLPEGARLQAVKIDGKSQPIRMEDGGVVIPLRPGRQTAWVEWHQASSPSMVTSAPRVGIGSGAVNARVSFHMPRNRWILWTHGPRLGPAVLFWTYLVVVILAATALGRIPWTPLRTGHWILLGLGLTQVQPVVAIGIVGWLLALGLRGNAARQEGTGWLRFNAQQILLALWTVAALVGMYTAVQKGLLGIPDMQIAGNGSTALALHWTRDRIGETLPQPWVASAPLMVFRVLMLLWALWLAFSLLRWLRWGWACFSGGGLWRTIRRKRKSRETPAEFEFQEKGDG